MYVTLILSINLAFKHVRNLNLLSYILKNHSGYSFCFSEEINPSFIIYIGKLKLKTRLFYIY